MNAVIYRIANDNFRISTMGGEIDCILTTQELRERLAQIVHNGQFLWAPEAIEGVLAMDVGDSTKVEARYIDNRRFFVRGGVYKDTTFTELEGPEENYGPYTYEEALEAWSGYSRWQIDICSHRLQICEA